MVIKAPSLLLLLPLLSFTDVHWFFNSVKKEKKLFINISYYLKLFKFSFFVILYNLLHFKTMQCNCKFFFISVVMVSTDNITCIENQFWTVIKQIVSYPGSTELLLR